MNYVFWIYRIFCILIMVTIWAFNVGPLESPSCIMHCMQSSVIPKRDHAKEFHKRPRRTSLSIRCRSILRLFALERHTRSSQQCIESRGWSFRLESAQQWNNEGLGKFSSDIAGIVARITLPYPPNHPLLKTMCTRQIIPLLNFCNFQPLGLPPALWDEGVDLTHNYTHYKAKVSLNDMLMFPIDSVGVVDIS